MTTDYQEVLYKQLCNKIRGVRLEMKLTQEEFSEKLNISRSSIVNIEKNRQRPTIHLLYDISLLCGLNMNYFFDTMPKKTSDQILSKKVEKKINVVRSNESKEKLQDFISKLPSKE